VTNEAIYVKTLGQGIKTYVTSMDNPDVPDDIRSEKSNIFGNIIEIYEMHANILHPGLVACGCDIIKISEMFTTMIANDNFYCYVLFMLNREQSVLLSNTHFKFFQDLQKAADGDKLGVGSFLLQPIQRLPRYQLLLNEVIKELMKSRQKQVIKKYLGAICKTEKNLERLLMLINESLSINEITSSGLVSLFNYL
jgi:RhoGEF domain